MGERKESQKEGNDVIEVEFLFDNTIYSMTRIVQWNCKGIRARHKEVWLLLNRFQPSCIYLHEIMLENVKYNLGREYEFYTIIPLGQRSKKRVTVTIKK